jgi:hypothetical protein
VREAKRSKTTRMSSTIASSILRSTSICAFISCGFFSLLSTNGRQSPA